MKLLSKSAILFGLMAFSLVNASANEPKLENLLSEELEGGPGIEVIVSRVQIPANTSLPKHWHPGEEFVYVLEGSATLWQKGKQDILVRQGEVFKIPLKQVHTAITGDEGVTALVFRVHEKGKPERVKAE
jgi:quercetin dioxygenase-like cupin family protein